MFTGKTKNIANDQFVYPAPEGSELIVLVPFRGKVLKDDQFAG